MTQALTTGRTFRARSGVAYVGGFLGLGLGLSALYATTGLGVLCPFRAVTGWDCPLCGGTRMGSALLHGDVGAALALNPLALLLVTAAGVLGLLWTVEALGGPAVRPPAVFRAGWRRLSPTGWLVLGLVLAAVYTVLRNIL